MTCLRSCSQGMPSPSHPVYPRAQDVCVGRGRRSWRGGCRALESGSLGRLGNIWSMGSGPDDCPERPA